MRRRTFIRNSLITIMAMAEASVTAREVSGGLPNTKSGDTGAKRRAIPNQLDESGVLPVVKRMIPKSDEAIPIIGMGTWLTFDVGSDPATIKQRAQVLETFFAAGGGMIDSSPMYGRAEAVLGELLAWRGDSKGLFAATKIWSALAANGPVQLRRSHQRWGVSPLDLVHVHNLLRWRPHLKTLRTAQEKGEVRYIGLTTSHGRRHSELENLMRTEAVEFVQFTYNIIDREAEKRLLPMAQDRGLAVVINRPFQTGGLFRRFAHQPLPDWAGEIEVYSWAEFFLKFVVSHPAVTCAIPATRQVAHMVQNMRAGTGYIPDERQRQRMVKYVESL